MNLEEHLTPKTITEIYDHYVKSRKSEHRPHLGGSQVGGDCERALWYQFRHADRPSFDGRKLRLFETGDLSESRFVKNLRDIGCEVWEHDEEGKQFRYTAHGGHFALSLDGVVLGLPDAPKTPHSLEFKTMNDKNFKALVKDGLEKSKPIYWAQVHIGMHLSDLTRCCFMAVNKNDDSLYMERVSLDTAFALQLLAKAGRVIYSEKPPNKLSEDPSFYKCKFCDFSDVCHKDKIPEVSCRTCARVTPETDGTWSCGLGHKECGTCHIFNPFMMPWEVSDAGEDWVEYEGGVRNQNNSEEIYKSWIPF